MPAQSLFVSWSASLSAGEYDPAQCPSPDCGSYAEVLVSFITVQLLVTLTAVIFIIRRQTHGWHAHSHSGLPDATSATVFHAQDRYDAALDIDDADIPKEGAPGVPVLIGHTMLGVEWWW
jgi:hypothetical protein